MQRLICIGTAHCLEVGDRQPLTPKLQQDGNKREISSLNQCMRSYEVSTSQARWHTPVIPAQGRAEAGCSHAGSQ